MVMYIAPMQEVGHAPHAVQARDAEGHDEVDFGGPDGQLAHKTGAYLGFRDRGGMQTSADEARGEKISGLIIQE